jgi:NTP pyrophosphatase (non-canonical NTP hydrolase)
MNKAEMIATVVDKMPVASLLEGMAEECAELAQGALKLARIIRGENPTPVTKEAAIQWVQEEIADLMLYIAVLREVGIEAEKCEVKKLTRWVERLNGIMDE